MERAERHVNPLLVMFAQRQDTDVKILQTIRKGNSLQETRVQIHVKYPTDTNALILLPIFNLWT